MISRFLFIIINDNNNNNNNDNDTFWMENSDSLWQPLKRDKPKGKRLGKVIYIPFLILLLLLLVVVVIVFMFNINIIFICH